MITAGCCCGCEDTAKLKKLSLNRSKWSPAVQRCCCGLKPGETVVAEGAYLLKALQQKHATPEGEEGHVH